MKTMTQKSTNSDPDITTNDYSIFDRAAGMLAGVAIGDALGMPVEMLTPEYIQTWYGEITDIVAPDSKHPHHRLPAGSITDDTDHTLLLAQILIDQGAIQPTELAKRLLAWSQTARVQENRFVGPSTLKTLAALQSGVALDKVPRAGTSVGAAMRVAPLAIAFPNRETLIDQVVASCAVSHYTSNAISGAMSMAFALSAALDPSADLQSISKAAKEGAIVGRNYGDWSWSPPIERRIDHVLDWVETLPEKETLARLYELIGVDMYPEQLVPCTIGLAYLAKGDPQRAMLLAANLGGDTDTLASMAGSLCGGWRGLQNIDQRWLKLVETTNQIDICLVAQNLIALRPAQEEQL
jgi:ADP-ribosylglycohydrolase